MPGAELALRALTVLAAAWATVTLLRKAPASLRAFVWTVTFGGVLVLPVVWMLVPAWRIAVLRPTDRTVHARPSSGQSSGSARQIDRAATNVTATISLSPSTSPSSSSSSLRLAPPDVPSRPAAEIPWRVVAIGVWAFGTLLLLRRILASHLKLADVARRAQADDSVIALAILPVDTGNVRICLTDDVAVPAVAGLIRPVLLLPTDAGSWMPDLLRSVIRHELAHVRRRDPIGRLIGQLACAVYWFVPLVWIGASRADALREQACDDEVLRSGVAASSYAASLIALAQQAGCAPVEAAALAMAAPSGIQERVMTILNPSVPRGAVTARASLVLSIAVGSAVTLAAAVLPVERVPLTLVGTPAPATVATTVVTSALAVTMPPTVAPPPTLVVHTQPTPPVPQTTPAPQVTAPRSGICGGDIKSSSSSSSSSNSTSTSTSSSGSSANSTSIKETDGRRTWKVTLRGPQCSVELRVDGRIEFNDDFTDVASLSSDGFLNLDVTESGVRRQLDIKSDRGTLVRTWRVDGREQPYDAAAKAWFANFLVELDRHTAVGADIRLPKLLRAGGVSAVLGETALISNDYARGVYYAKLATATRLSNADVARVLDQAASLKTSDFYASEVIKNLGTSVGDDAGVRSAMLRLVQAMGSDYYITESSRAALAHGRLTSTELDFLAQVVPKIQSGYYKTELLKQIVAAGRPDAAARAALARVARDIREDNYAADFITTLIGNGDLGRDGARALIDASTTVDQDYYRAEVVSALASRLKLEEADLLSMIQSIRPKTSDFYKSQMLRSILRNGGATDRVREAAIDATAGMSTYYRDEVQRTAGIRGR